MVPGLSRGAEGWQKASVASKRRPRQGFERFRMPKGPTWKAKWPKMMDLYIYVYIDRDIDIDTGTAL